MLCRSGHHANRRDRHRAGRGRDSLYHPAGAAGVSTKAVTVAVAQFASSWDKAGNIAKAKDMVRLAASRGANVVVLPELFATPYFCQDQLVDHFGLAQEFHDNALIAEFSSLAKELSVVLPLSFFERASNAYFNA